MLVQRKGAESKKARDYYVCKRRNVQAREEVRAVSHTDPPGNSLKWKFNLFQLTRRSAAQIPPHTAFRTSFPDNGFETKGPRMDAKAKELAGCLVEKIRK